MAQPRAASHRFSVSYQEFVARLMRAQWQANQEAALAWRIKRAGLPEQWTLESFPFKRQPGVNQRQIRTFAAADGVDAAQVAELARGGWVERAENVLLAARARVERITR
jgi:hypothetical protein